MTSPDTKQEELIERQAFEQMLVDARWPDLEEGLSEWCLADAAWNAGKAFALQQPDERDEEIARQGVAWLRELAGTCKAEASNCYRDAEDDEVAEEWRVRGESYAFIADQIERGHTPFARTALGVDHG